MNVMEVNADFTQFTKVRLSNLEGQVKTNDSNNIIKPCLGFEA